MTLAHTPGPWILGETSHDILGVSCEPVASPCDGYDEAQWLIDGALIAAAPDLLAACRRMLDCHQAAMDAAQSGSSSFVSKMCDCGACDEARAAIAKAEGQA